MVSIITVNYNGYKDTCELIDSFIEYENFPYEFIVWDNDSKGDDVRLLVEKNYPENVRIIAGNANLGFAGGNNAAYKYSNGEYILYINNDTVIKEPVLENMVSLLAEREKAGIVSSKIKFFYNPDILQYAGYSPMNYYTVSNFQIGNGEKDEGQYDKPERTNYANGACMMIKRTVAEKAGFIPEIYFMFYEELDWCEKIKKAGYEIWYQPLSEVYHKEGMSIKMNTPFRYYYLSRSRILFARRNNKGIVLIISLLYMLFAVFLRDTAKCIIHGDFKMLKSVAKGTAEGFFIRIRNRF